MTLELYEAQVNNFHFFFLHCLVLVNGNLLFLLFGISWEFSLKLDHVNEHKKRGFHSDAIVHTLSKGDNGQADLDGDDGNDVDDNNTGVSAT